MSICETCQVVLDERARYDNDIYFKVIENTNTYCILKSVKTGIHRKIVKNDKYLNCIVNQVIVIEPNYNYDFSGLGQNGVMLYDDPDTLTSWSINTNVLGASTNSLFISSWGGIEGTYNSPYLPTDDRALGVYFSASAGKFIRYTANFTVPDGNTQTTITITTYSAWSRFNFNTKRWAGMRFFIDGDSSTSGVCQVTNENDLTGTTWYDKTTSNDVCETSKTFSTTPGVHTLTLTFDGTTGLRVPVPVGYDRNQEKNVHLAVDNIFFEYA